MPKSKQMFHGDAEMQEIFERRVGEARADLVALASHEVVPPDKWRRHTQPEYIFPGLGFEMAVRLLLDSGAAAEIELGRDAAATEAWLVHAERGGCIRHACVEVAGTVFDGVLQRFYDPDGYYAVTGATPRFCYTPPAVSLLMLNGPRYEGGRLLLEGWHGLLGLPTGGPPEPQRISTAVLLSTKCDWLTESTWRLSADGGRAAWSWRSGRTGGVPACSTI